MKSNIAAIILTYNEESNIEQCLKSVSGWADEIFLIDSYSTDQTVAIAKIYKTQIIAHPFKNQAEQFNWGLENLKIKSDWILKLDADEYLTPELKEEILEKLPETPDEINGFYMKRKVYFMGRWIRHGDYYPFWLLRLFRRGKAKSEIREMDEHIVLMSGAAEKFKNDFVDDNRNDLTAWTDKHNKYAYREAAAHLKEGSLGQSEASSKKIFYYRLPIFLRTFLYFFYRYFLRLGFLDGKEGLIFHFLQGFWYRFLVDAKIYELRKRR